MALPIYQWSIKRPKQHIDFMGQDCSYAFLAITRYEHSFQFSTIYYKAALWKPINYQDVNIFVIA